jgi:hypothetical protein
MSDRLTLAAAASVLMMSVFVLFGQGSSRAPIGVAQLGLPSSVSMSSLPGASRLIPAVR